MWLKRKLNLRLFLPEIKLDFKYCVCYLYKYQIFVANTIFL